MAKAGASLQAASTDEAHLPTTTSSINLPSVTVTTAAVSSTSDAVNTVRKFSNSDVSLYKLLCQLLLVCGTQYHRYVTCCLVVVKYCMPVSAIFCVSVPANSVFALSIVNSTQPQNSIYIFID